MTTLFAWAWIAPLAVILLAGAIWTVRYSPSPAASMRTRGLYSRLAPAFGRISGTILVLAAGTGVSIAICWPVGYGARNFDSNDHKVYNWVARHQTQWLHTVMRWLTMMSNNRQTQVVAALFMVVLTVAWFFRRRGLVVLAPAVLIMAAYEIEHQLQHTLKLLADRKGRCRPISEPSPQVASPDWSAFTDSSCYLILRHLGKTRSKLAVALWTLLAAATYTESYSRLYLGKHWISDIFGGLVFGVILLLVLIVAAQMLDRSDGERENAVEVSTNARFAGAADPGTTAVPAESESPLSHRV